MTTQDDIRRWLEEAKAEGATHMLVVCDTFDWSDYPVKVKDGAEAAKNLASEYQTGKHSMQKIMEVYKIDAPWEPQLNTLRSFTY